MPMQNEIDSRAENSNLRMRAVGEMGKHELAAKILREESAPVLEELMQTMADPRAKARERLKAVRTFKRCLHSLKRLVEAQQTTPALRRDLIEVLRKYHGGIASAYRAKYRLTS